MTSCEKFLFIVYIFLVQTAVPHQKILTQDIKMLCFEIFGNIIQIRNPWDLVRINCIRLLQPAIQNNLSFYQSLFAILLFGKLVV